MSRLKFSDLLELSVAERIELVQDIWDSIGESSEDLQVTEYQKAELDARSLRLNNSPDTGTNWDVVKEEISKSILDR